MGRLIDEDELLKQLELYLNKTLLGEITVQTELSVGEICSLIKDCPAIDAEQLGRESTILADTKTWKSEMARIKSYYSRMKKEHRGEPVYEIMLFENPNKELIYKSGKKSGFPDTGSECVCGFYHSIDEAIDAVSTNAGDMRETIYDAGFILCRFPGIYSAVVKEGRIYFVWNNDNHEYRPETEPGIFRNMAY